MNKKTYQVKFDSLNEYIFENNFDYKEFCELCKSWSGRSGTITIDCSKKKSNKLNAYFWGVIVPHYQIAINKYMEKHGKKERANDLETEHFIRKNYFSYEKEFVKKETILMSLKNIDWDHEDFSNKCEQIREDVLHRFGYTIPEPNEG